MICFTYNGEVWFIREWNVDKFLRYIQFKEHVELWADVGLSVIPPEPIMYQGGLR